MSALFDVKVATNPLSKMTDEQIKDNPPPFVAILDLKDVNPDKYSWPLTISTGVPVFHSNKELCIVTLSQLITNTIAGSEVRSTFKKKKTSFNVNDD